MNIKTDIESFAHKYHFTIDQEEDSHECTLGGYIDIIDPNEGFLWDSYFVVYYINLENFYDNSKPKNKSYPSSLPKVYLMNHDEIKIPERHIDSDHHGLCCLAPNTECQLILGKNYTLADFTEKLVKPFFVAQVIYENTGNWPFGDYKHYTEGLLEYYALRLNISLDMVENALSILTEKSKLQRNELCFCGSGKKFKNCHRNLFDEIHFIVNQEYLLNDYYEIKNYNKKKDF